MNVAKTCTEVVVHSKKIWKAFRDRCVVFLKKKYQPVVCPKVCMYVYIYCMYLEGTCSIMLDIRIFGISSIEYKIEERIYTRYIYIFDIYI